MRARLPILVHPTTNLILRQLQFQTADVLSQQGEGRLADAVAYCHSGSQCNRRQLCPRCTFIRSLTRWTALEATFEELPTDSSLVFVSVTAKPDRDPLVSNLRQTSDSFFSNLQRRIGRLPGIAGSVLMFETVPSRLPTGELEEGRDHPHVHAVLIFGADRGPVYVPHALRGFDHAEIVTAERAQGFIPYGLKARPSDFTPNWGKLLDSPATFLERARQLKGFRPVRTTGYLKTTISRSLQPPRAANSIAA